MAVFAGVALVSREGAAADRAAGEAVPWAGLALPLVGAFGVEPILATVGLDAGTPVLAGLASKVVAATLGLLAYLAWRDSLPAAGTLWGQDARWPLLVTLASALFLRRLERVTRRLVVAAGVVVAGAVTVTLAG